MVLGESGINLRAAQKLALKAMVNSSAVKLVRQEERSKEDAAADSNRGHGEGQSERTLCKKRDRPRGRDGRPRGPNPRPGTEVLTIPVVPARRAAMMESSCDIGAVINERTAPASRWLATKALRNDVFASVGLKKKETDTEKGFVELHVSSAQQACFLPVVQDTTVLALDPSTGSRLDGGAPLALARELSSLMSTICDTAQHNALKDALAVDDELATLPPLLFGIELQATNGSLEIERFNFDITPPAAWGTELSFALMNQAIIADEVVGRYYATDAARGVRQCEAEAREENRSKANFPVCSFPGLHERQSEHENECAVLIVHNAASAADEQRIVLIHNAFVAMDVHVGVIGLHWLLLLGEHSMPVAALAVLFSLRSIVEIGGDGAWGQVGHEVDLVSQSSIASEAGEDFASAEAVSDDLDGTPFGHGRQRPSRRDSSCPARSG